MASCTTRTTCADSTARCKDGAACPGLFWLAVPRRVPRHHPRRVRLGGHSEGTYAAVSARLLAERWACRSRPTLVRRAPSCSRCARWPRYPRRRREPGAYALLRAAVAHDADAAVLLVFNVAHVAARAMLGAEGYDVAKVLRVLDSWMDEAVHGVQRPPGRTA